MKRLKKTVFVENSDQQRRRGVKGWMFFAAARRPDIKSAGVLRIFFQWASICRVDRSIENTKADLSHSVFEREQMRSASEAERCGLDSTSHKVNRIFSSTAQ